VKAAAKRRLALGEAMAELERLGVPVEVDPAEAMLQMVYEAAGNVAVLRGWVQQLRGAESLIEGADADDVLEAMAQLGSGKTTVAKSRKGVVAGRVDPANWKAAPHVLVTMYNDERGRLVKWAKDCRDAGVEDRRIQLAERQGELLAGVLRSLLAGLLGALTAAVLPETELRKVWATEVPGLVRAALGAAENPSSVNREGPAPLN
jgi:hypothetical protein